MAPSCLSRSLDAISSVKTRLFLIICLLEGIINISIETVLLVKFELLHQFFENASSEIKDARSALPVYLGIFVLAHIFQLALAMDAIYQKNTIQLIGLCMFNFAFLIYAIIQISEIRQAFANLAKEISILIDLIPIVISVSGVAYCYLTWHLFKEFGWQNFKEIGADRTIKRAYFIYQIYICILKFDYFFFIAFSLQFTLLVLRQGDIERSLTVAAIPITLVLLIAGFYGVKREHKPTMWIFLGMCVVGAAYFLFKVFRIYQGKNEAYSLVFKSLTIFSVLSLVLLLATVGVAYMCLRNFGVGLKPQLQKKKRQKGKGEEYSTQFLSDGHGMHYQLESAKSSRMSID